MDRRLTIPGCNLHRLICDALSSTSLCSVPAQNLPDLFRHGLGVLALKNKKRDSLGLEAKLFRYRLSVYLSGRIRTVYVNIKPNPVRVGVRDAPRPAAGFLCAVCVVSNAISRSGSFRCLADENSDNCGYWFFNFSISFATRLMNC